MRHRGLGYRGLVRLVLAFLAVVVTIAAGAVPAAAEAEPPTAPTGARWVDDVGETEQVSAGDEWLRAAWNAAYDTGSGVHHYVVQLAEDETFAVVTSEHTTPDNLTDFLLGPRRSETSPWPGDRSRALRAAIRQSISCGVEASPVDRREVEAIAVGFRRRSSPPEAVRRQMPPRRRTSIRTYLPSYG